MNNKRSNPLTGKLKAIAQQACPGHVFTTTCIASALLLSALPADSQEIAVNAPQAPIERTIANAEGVVLEGSIIGRMSDKIRFRRNDKKEFTLAINTLSVSDQEFINTLPEGIYQPADAIKKEEAVAEKPKAEPKNEEANNGFFKEINDDNELFLGLPYTKQERAGICVAAAVLNCLQYMDPTIKMSHEEMFDLFHDGSSAASFQHIESGLAAFNIKANPMNVSAKSEDVAKQIRFSLDNKMPVLTGNMGHMMVTVGHNKVNDSLALWDQRLGGEVDNKTGKPSGTSILTEKEYLRKIKIAIFFIRSPIPEGSLVQRGILPTEKILEEKVGKPLFIFGLKPAPSETDLEAYLTHAMQPRLAVEFRRNRRVLIPVGASEFLEVLAEPTDKKIWRVKKFGTDEVKEIKHKELVEVLFNIQGKFIAIDPAGLAPK